MIFEQLFDDESSTFTYLIGDEIAKVGALIDPVAEQLARDLARIDAHGLGLIHNLETHIHADHVTAGSALTADRHSLPVLHYDSPVACEALRVRDGDVVKIGAISLRVIETPGHTPESISFYLAPQGGEPGCVFTGDALLIGSCGRTDFQGGDAGQLYDSITKKLYALPDDTKIFPGHDYKGNRVTTIAEQKATNTRVAHHSRLAFIKIMSELNLPPPKKLAEALPANLRCGERPKQA